jgi:hypothetical protein
MSALQLRPGPSTDLAEWFDVICLPAPEAVEFDAEIVDPPKAVDV